MKMHQHRRSRIEPEYESNRKIKEQRFDFAFLITLGIFALFFLLVFVPVIGLILTLTLIPYTAGYHGGRFVNKKDGFLVAFLAGFIWSSIEIWIFYSILRNLDLAVNPPGIHTGLDWTIIILIFLGNIMFCVVGVIYSPRKFDDDDE